MVLENRYDLATARHHLAAALAINPRHVPALLVRAGIEIDQNQWDAARKTIAEVLAINPQSTKAHALEATIAWLRDDTAGYDARQGPGVRDRRHRRGSVPDGGAGRRCASIATSRRSSCRSRRWRCAPDAYDAMSDVGLGYLRLGRREAGRRVARQGLGRRQVQRPHLQHAQPVPRHDPARLHDLDLEVVPLPLPQGRARDLGPLPRADPRAGLRRHGQALRLHAQDPDRDRAVPGSRSLQRPHRRAAPTWAPSACASARSSPRCRRRTATSTGAW
jgi:tetratricopeptide (TPR) repeat protein